MRRPALLFLAITLFAAVSLAAAQSQPPPPEKKKPRKVWTNEDLSGIGGTINVVGQAAPPPSEGKPAQTSAAPSASAWEELDQLKAEREDTKAQVDLNRRAVESITAKLNDETNAANKDELLQGRNWQEEQVRNYEARLEQIDARIAELEKQTKGKKRPAKLKPAPAQPSAAPAKPAEPSAPPEQPAPPPPPPSR